MAVRRRTLRAMRQLRVVVGEHADQSVRDLTNAWVRAWDELESGWRQAVLDVVAKAAADGVWPPPWQLARMDRLAAALVSSARALDELGERAGVTVTAAAGRIIAATVEAEPVIYATQLPSALADEAVRRFARRIRPGVLDVIVARTTDQITALTRPLSVDATEALNRALVRGVALGSGPETVARDMLARVEGAFAGGLARATTVARTECLEAYRETSRYCHTANADVLDGWTWMATVTGPQAVRTCTSCWAMHGQTFPVERAGPEDHVQGRCARLPKAKSWRDLGIDLDEPEDAIPDARTLFDALPEADQVAILGRARLELLRSGAIGWTDLAVRRDNPGWRPSYVPTPVGDLRRIADRDR